MTLRPVFEGSDRQEILRQIAFDEPRPPRQINSTIPIELETIVLKALAKNVEERYGTAQELADDLQRYLCDEPIRARRNTLIDRGRKWARRHPAWIAATVICLCLTIVVLGISNILIAWERDAKSVALHAKDEALAKAKKAEESEAERRVEADKERERAEANFRKAREAVDRVFILAAEKMADQPHMEQIRRALLEDALEFYQGFLKEKNNDPTIRHQTARAYWRVGSIFEMLGKNEQAEANLTEGIKLLKALVADYPAMPEYNDDLLECQSSLAFVFQQMSNRSDEHIATRSAILTIAEKRVLDCPTIPAYARRLALCHTDYANSVVEFRPAEAEKHCRRAVELWTKFRSDFPNEPEDRRGIAFSRHWLGKALSNQRQYAAAEAEFRISMEIREQLLSTDPQNTGLQSELAHVQDYLASVLMTLVRLPEAEQQIRRAIALAEKLADDFPEIIERQRKVADYYETLGNILIALGRTEEGRESIKKCLTIRKQIVAKSPSMLSVAYYIGWNHYRLGLLSYDDSQPTEAIESFRQAQIVFESAIKNRPEGPSQVHALAFFLVDCPAVQFRDPERAVQLAKKCLQIAPGTRRFWSTLGAAQLRSGNWRDAITALQKSIELGAGGVAFEWLCLSMAHWQMGEKDQAKQWLNKAQEWMDKNSHKNEELIRYRLEAEALIRESKSE